MNIILFLTLHLHTPHQKKKQESKNSPQKVKLILLVLFEMSRQHNEYIYCAVNQISVLED